MGPKIFFSSLIKKKTSKDPRFILLLTEETISLFFFSASHKPSLIRLTQVSLEASASHLLSFLKEGPGIPIDIFHDMPDQTLKIETIPPNLHGLDPYRWVQNKRRSFMESADFSGSHWYPEKNKKSKNILFAFFKLSPALASLLQHFETLQNPVRGVYALALEQIDVYQQLHKALSPAPTKWLLGIHFEDNGRMRHTVMHEGKFVLSRLFPPLLTSQTILSQEENKIREIQGTLRYLVKQFSISSSQIHTIFWGEEFSTAAIAQVAETEYWALTAAQSALLLNLPALLSHVEIVFLTWFYTRTKPAFLMLKHQSKRRKKIVNSLQQSGVMIAWGVSISLWLTAGVIMLQAYNYKENIALLEKKRSLLQAQHMTMDKELLALPLTAAQGRYFLLLRQDLGASAQTLFKIVEKLGSALGNEMRLRQLEWETEFSQEFHYSLMIESYCLSSSLSQKQLTHLFDSFLEKLKKQFPNGTLDVVHGPYSTHKTQLLTGGIHDEEFTIDPTCIVKLSW